MSSAAWAARAIGLRDMESWMLVSFARHGRSKPQSFPSRPAGGIYPANPQKCAVRGLDSRFRGNDRRFERDPIPNDTTTESWVVGQFAVAAVTERRNSLRIQDRRSETAATKIKLTHYRNLPPFDECPTV